MSGHSKLHNFLHSDAAPGILLCFSAIVALITINSPLSHWYHEFLETHVMFEVGHWKLQMHLLHWINDALMAVFFLLVGLEIKREMLEGELATFGQVILPGIAAAGGMIVPAGIFVLFNLGDATALKGWAIPSATDIAFALGIISLFGKRVPVSLKVFLTALAIFDDLGAIVIIALFYSSDMSFSALGISAALLGVAYAMNRKGVTKIAPYMMLGVFLWYFVLQSGVHATLAGVTLAFMIPNKDQ
ncbi:MAG: Na+/H+ antiporter NhaA, partial [Bdellovibrionales bacterium]|nr:Na+/H+ antiporter NhaA [Bdellovibrionales bacterium]